MAAVSEYRQIGSIESPVDFVAAYMSATGTQRFEMDALMSPSGTALYDAAVSYLKAYSGDFEFLLKLQRAMRHHGAPTDAQAKGVLNCIAAEVRRRGPKPEDTPSAVNEIIGDFSKVPSGTYTIVNPEDGSYATVRIKEWKSKGDGTRVAAFMSGPDNESSFTAFATITPDGSAKVWHRFSNEWKHMGTLEQLAAATPDDHGGFREAWAMRSGKCAMCGRKLTVPTSLYRGIGPECHKKLIGVISDLVAE